MWVWLTFNFLWSQGQGDRRGNFVLGNLTVVCTRCQHSTVLSNLLPAECEGAQLHHANALRLAGLWDSHVCKQLFFFRLCIN